MAKEEALLSAIMAAVAACIEQETARKPQPSPWALSGRQRLMRQGVQWQLKEWGRRGELRSSEERRR